MPDLDSLRTTLLTATGLTPDLTTDVGRWQLYRTAAEDTANHATLLQAATAEPDRTLATALVVHMLSLTPTADHPTWLATLASSERAYASQRSTEYGLLRTPPSCATLAQDLDNYTNWLQRRLAESLTDPTSLLELAAHARAKRTRHIARTRARALLD
ncbi:hypothetical protein [Kribbella ginsengisoli]|uniref:Uncharacterized protein n=1 Tax=Kribbella ginsengisoli TaxID=363865 RepID=A0ABP6X918_9ACTN